MTRKRNIEMAMLAATVVISLLALTLAMVLAWHL